MEKIYYKKIAWTALVLSLIGFLDTLYLTYEHFTGSAVNCALLTGCDKVLTSQYSTIIGIPLALLGMIYYLVVLALATHLVQSGLKKVFNLMLLVISCGFLFSLWLVFLQIFVLKALCTYCLISALDTTILFVLGLFFAKIKGLKESSTKSNEGSLL